MATSAELLKRHRPFLKYDSQESYFSDSAATWTDNPGNRLLDKNGKELASAGHGLSPAFLGLTYPDGRKADRRDLIGNPSKNYREQARKLHENRRYANRMYGHAVVDSNDDLWLQYWFWYFFNDYNLIGNFIKAGLHEGDWEMIQIRLQDETPDLAIYAQHATAETRRWSQVDVVPGTQRPLVYVARGSHAAYFEPGRHWTGHWFDYADAKRKSPEISLNIVVEDDEDWRWIRWPGRWGDTKKGDNPLDSDSPDGPADHDQWDDPLVMVEKAAERPRAAGGAAASTDRAARARGVGGQHHPRPLHGPARAGPPHPARPGGDDQLARGDPHRRPPRHSRSRPAPEAST